MSDWQIGDLALCVDSGAFGIHSYCPTLIEGHTYRVSSIILAAGISCLTLAGVIPVAPDTGLFNESRFRKIRPDEHEACEPEFVTLLKRSKAPSREKVK